MRSRGGMDMQHTLNTKTEFMTRWDGLTTGGYSHLVGAYTQKQNTEAPEPWDEKFWQWPGDIWIPEGRF